MKIKHALILLILGFLLVLVGSVFKVNHLQGAPTLLMLGLLAEAVGVILLIYKLVTNQKVKEFLNS